MSFPSVTKKTCLKCTYDADKGLCSVLLFEVVNEKSLNVDQVDGGFRSIQPRWHSSTEAPDSLSTSKEYALVPVEIIPGVVHVLERNLEHCNVHPSVCQRNLLKS